MPFSSIARAANGLGLITRDCCAYPGTKSPPLRLRMVLTIERCCRCLKTNKEASGSERRTALTDFEKPKSPQSQRKRACQQAERKPSSARQMGVCLYFVRTVAWQS